MLPVLFCEWGLESRSCPYFPLVFVFKNKVLVILPVIEDEEFVFAPSLAFPSSKPVSPLIVLVFKRLASSSSILLKATKPANPVFRAA